MVAPRREAASPSELHARRCPQRDLEAWRDGLAERIDLAMREYQKELLLRALTRHDWTPAMDSHLSFDSQLSAQSQALVAKLLEESRFAPGGVGHAGTMSRGKTLTRQLSHRPDAVAAFDWLANQRIPVSQLHACGALRTLAPSHARVHATELVAIAGR